MQRVVLILLVCCAHVMAQGFSFPQLKFPWDRDSEEPPQSSVDASPEGSIDVEPEGSIDVESPEGSADVEPEGSAEQPAESVETPDSNAENPIPPAPTTVAPTAPAPTTSAPVPIETPEPLPQEPLPETPVASPPVEVVTTEPEVQAETNSDMIEIQGDASTGENGSSTWKIGLPVALGAIAALALAARGFRRAPKEDEVLESDFIAREWKPVVPTADLSQRGVRFADDRPNSSRYLVNI